MPVVGYAAANPGGHVETFDASAYAVNALALRRIAAAFPKPSEWYPTGPPWSARQLFAQAEVKRRARLRMAAPIARENAIRHLETNAREYGDALVDRILRISHDSPGAGQLLAAGAAAAATLGGAGAAGGPVLAAIGAAVGFIAGTVFGFIRWDQISLLADWHTAMRALTPAERYFVLSKGAYCVNVIADRRGYARPDPRLGAIVYTRDEYSDAERAPGAPDAPARRVFRYYPDWSLVSDCMRECMDTKDQGGAFPDPGTAHDRAAMGLWAALTATSYGSHAGVWGGHMFTAADLAHKRCSEFNSFRDLRDAWSAPWLAAELARLNDVPHGVLVGFAADPARYPRIDAATAAHFGASPRMTLESPPVPRSGVA